MLDAELLTLGLKFHGHKCPAMPMGLRAGVAAMRALGVEPGPGQGTVCDQRNRGRARGGLLPGRRHDFHGVHVREGEHRESCGITRWPSP